MDAGHQAVERCHTLLPAETPSIRTLCEVQHPAAFILDSAAAVKADLIAVGTHDHSRVREVFARQLLWHARSEAQQSRLRVSSRTSMSLPVKATRIAREPNMLSKTFSATSQEHETD
jgi:hypothetical protein